MPVEPTVDCTVQALRDQLNSLADALVRGDVAALEAGGAIMDGLATALCVLAATDVTSPATPRLLTEARWALLRCQRLGQSLAAVAGGPRRNGSTSTYLPSGARSTVSAWPTSSFEVSV